MENLVFTVYLIFISNENNDYDREKRSKEVETRIEWSMLLLFNNYSVCSIFDVEMREKHQENLSVRIEKTSLQKNLFMYIWIDNFSWLFAPIPMLNIKTNTI